MSEDKEEVKEEKEKEEQTIVIKELPVQQVRSGTTEDGTPVKMITIEEALSEMYTDMKTIKKAVA